MNMIPEFLQGDATNVYRTREYIVKQSVTLHFDERYGAVLYSNDTYYRCTPFRDREYEAVFANRAHINGKRIHTAMYASRTVSRTRRCCRCWSDKTGRGRRAACGENRKPHTFQ